MSTLYEYVGGYELNYYTKRKRLAVVKMTHRRSIDFLPTDMLHPIISVTATTMKDARKQIKEELSKYNETRVNMIKDMATRYVLAKEGTPNEV